VIEALTVFAGHDANGAGEKAPREVEARWCPAGQDANLFRTECVGDLNLLPLPAKLGGALLWRRGDIEARKARLFGLPAPELVTAAPTELVTARDLAGELRVGIRTLRRRLAKAGAAAADQGSIVTSNASPRSR
jgi:hypothetical protein